MSVVEEIKHTISIDPHWVCIMSHDNCFLSHDDCFLSRDFAQTFGAMSSFF